MVPCAPKALAGQPPSGLSAPTTLNTTKIDVERRGVAFHFDDRVMGGVMTPPLRRMRLHQRGNGFTNGFRPDQLAKKLRCACIVVENLGLAFGQEDIAHSRSVCGKMRRRATLLTGWLRGSIDCSPYCVSQTRGSLRGLVSAKPEAGCIRISAAMPQRLIQGYEGEWSVALGPVTPVYCSVLASVVERLHPWRVMVLVNDQAELFAWTRDAEVEKTAGLAKSGRIFLVALTGKIARIRAVHQNGIELPSLRAVQRAQADAAGPRNTVGKLGKLDLGSDGRVGVGDHLGEDLPLLLPVSRGRPPWRDRPMRKQLRHYLGRGMHLRHELERSAS
jgi:hypothetical protein